ncbi:hypothetical protein NUM_20610 [Actinocatenispora comari]|uniref:Uncharacterized protein n=1 Tax=Actinocatenispora comari TaxID=2807577 RepID=A0A8J4ACV6_9ACTN|nr:hypothetical protein NUM_20610 [Actinocatenispora comari]
MGGRATARCAPIPGTFTATQSGSGGALRAVADDSTVDAARYAGHDDHVRNDSCWDAHTAVLIVACRYPPGTGGCGRAPDATFLRAAGFAASVRHPGLPEWPGCRLERGERNQTPLSPFAVSG